MLSPKLHRAHFLAFVLFLAFGCSTTNATKNEEALKSESTNGAEQAPTTTAPKEEPVTEEIASCEPQWTREQKLRTLDSAVDKSDKETQSVKDGFLNANQRSRLAILSAGLIPDDVPFVTLDRSCWSEFYRAHKFLRDGNVSLAKKIAGQWRTCLSVNFEQRSKQARGLYSCFGLPEETADEPGDATGE